MNNVNYFTDLFESIPDYKKIFYTNVDFKR